MQGLLIDFVVRAVFVLWLFFFLAKYIFKDEKTNNSNTKGIRNRFIRWAVSGESSAHDRRRGRFCRRVPFHGLEASRYRMGGF